MYIDHNTDGVWEHHIAENNYTYYTFSCAIGAAIVEPTEDRWFWQVDKPEDGTFWCDEIYELEHLDGWWGTANSKEEAQTAATKALGLLP